MTATPAAVPAARSVQRALVQWLLRLIQTAPDAFLTLGQVDSVEVAPGGPEAIELELMGRRFRIVVEEVG
jgi:hypothetical protein